MGCAKATWNLEVEIVVSAIRGGPHSGNPSSIYNSKRLICVLIIVTLVCTCSRAGTEDYPVAMFASEAIDSVAEERVRCYKQELIRYGESSDDFEMCVLIVVLARCDAGDLALSNFKTLRALERQRALELAFLGDDTLVNLGDDELLTIVYAMLDNFHAIDRKTIGKSESLIASIKRPAVSQAARDLIAAWKDIRQAMLQKSPFLPVLLESGVWKKDWKK